MIPAGVNVKMPENRSKKEHLLHLAYLKRNVGMAEATQYWLRHCPRISRKAFNEA